MLPTEAPWAVGRPEAPIAPRLSVVIVSWNTRELLLQCLESIRATSAGGGVEVVVVDNASADGSVQAVGERAPWAHVLGNTENVGFARANNQAISATRGDYVLLLNPDTEVHSGALETLVRFMDEHPRTGAAGARLLNPDGSLQRSCYPAPTLTRELWRLLHLDALWPYGGYDMARWPVDTPRQVDVVQGACLIVRRAALDQVGLLDEDYFIYSEEVDLCQRLHRGGWKIWWVPAAQVVHYGGQSTRQVATAMFLRLYESKVLYFRKHHGPQGAAAYKLVVLAAALFRLLLAPLALLEAAPRRQQHLALAHRYRRLSRALLTF